MLELNRLTSEYIQSEDRFRLTGEDQHGNSLCLWLTQRLALRIVSHLVSELSTSSPEAIQNPSQDHDTSQLLQGVAQQTALAGLCTQEPVTSTSTTRAWLIQEVDINRAPDGTVGFFFKDGEQEDVVLGFRPQQLRQWLTIIHAQWLVSEWPATIWPEWISGKAPEAKQEPTAIAPQTSKPIH
jgi:hypothetical protein